MKSNDELLYVVREPFVCKIVESEYGMLIKMIKLVELFPNFLQADRKTKILCFSLAQVLHGLTFSRFSPKPETGNKLTRKK